MSTDVLPEILTLLQKHENLSVKVFFKTIKTGTQLTIISFKETGIQSHPDSSQSSSKKPEDGGKKVRKVPAGCWGTESDMILSCPERMDPRGVARDF